MTLIARNDLKGVKFIGWHISDFFAREWQTIENQLYHKFVFDTAMSLGTNIREWQLDLLPASKRNELLKVIANMVERRGWKIARFGNTAQIYTDL